MATAATAHTSSRSASTRPSFGAAIRSPSPATFLRRISCMCAELLALSLQILYDELQTRVAVPAVGLDRVGQFDARARPGRCSVAFGPAPPDAVVDAPA